MVNIDYFFVAFGNLIFSEGMSHKHIVHIKQKPTGRMRNTESCGFSGCVWNQKCSPAVYFFFQWHPLSFPPKPWLPEFCRSSLCKQTLRNAKWANAGRMHLTIKWKARGDWRLGVARPLSVDNKLQLLIKGFFRLQSRLIDFFFSVSPTSFCHCHTNSMYLPCEAQMAFHNPFS